MLYKQNSYLCSNAKIFDMLRIKEICKQQGITVTELAKRLGISQESLSRQIHGNPTVKWLTKVADELGVNIVDLFANPENAVSGFVEFNGDIHRITSRADLERLLSYISKVELEKLFE
jgi:transcriptional regulator with XRE-family HTH domain